jgi:hypothetical protein
MAKTKSQEKFKPEQIAEALRHSAGIYTQAALIAGCSPSTIKNYVERYAWLQELVNELSEQHLDLAEGKLLKAINEGNLTAIIFYLKTKGKHRGYCERREVSAVVPDLKVYLPATVDEDKLAAEQEARRLESGRVIDVDVQIIEEPEPDDDMPDDGLPESFDGVAIDPEQDGFTKTVEPDPPEDDAEVEPPPKEPELCPQCSKINLVEGSCSSCGYPVFING